MRALDWIDGEKVVRDMTADELASIQGPSVSLAQMRIALHRLGELDAVQAIADADPEASIVWEYATRIDRNSPLIAALSAGHYTVEEIDGMFAAAARVTI